MWMDGWAKHAGVGWVRYSRRDFSISSRRGAVVEAQTADYAKEGWFRCSTLASGSSWLRWDKAENDYRSQAPVLLGGPYLSREDYMQNYLLFAPSRKLRTRDVWANFIADLNVSYYSFGRWFKAYVVCGLYLWAWSYL